MEGMQRRQRYLPPHRAPRRRHGLGVPQHRGLPLVGDADRQDLDGLATGLGARYPRFAAENPSQVAGSYGGVAFMVLAVLFVIVTIALVGWPSSAYLAQQLRLSPMSTTRQALMYGSFAAAALVSVATFWLGMRTGIAALEDMDRTPS